MSSKSKILFSAAIFLAFFLGFLSDSFAIDEDIIDKYPSVEQPPVLTEEQQAKRKYVYLPDQNMEVRGFVDLQQGYNNNVELSPSRYKDGFIQVRTNIDIAHLPADNLKIKTGIDLFDITYYKYNINNLFDVSPYVGFDWKILPGLISRNRCIYDYLSYPNYKRSTFSGIVLSSYLRHYFLKNIYHEVGYEYLRRWYPDRKIYNADGRRCSTERIDDRYRVKYIVRGKFFSRFYVKLINEFSRNDSNYSYQEYYDYWYYRLKPSAMFFITKQFYTDANLLYKYIRYKDRRNTEDDSETARYHTFLLNTSLYYDIFEDLTLGVTYSYTENLSNDPYREYSGSTISAGIYYTF